ncbi:MAG TPA: biotin synthase BioB, partial [Noviherbaspirillum sp.]|nr:biotin synthase BioB [Noviherbaspirillum sp.]
MSSQPIAFYPSPSAPSTAASPSTWPVEQVMALFDMPFNDLLFRAQQVHRQHFDPSEVELATLLSIKTGG